MKKLPLAFLISLFMLSLSACGVYTVTNGTAGLSQRKIDSLVEGQSTTNDVLTLFGDQPESTNRRLNGDILEGFHTLRTIEAFTKTKFTKEERSEFDLNAKYLMWRYRKSIDSMLGSVTKPINIILLFDENGVLMRKFQFEE